MFGSVAATPVFGSALDGVPVTVSGTEPSAHFCASDGMDGLSQQVVAVLVMVPFGVDERTVTSRVITGADAETPRAADRSQSRVPPKPSASVPLTAQFCQCGNPVAAVVIPVTFRLAGIGSDRVTGYATPRVEVLRTLML